MKSRQCLSYTLATVALLTAAAPAIARPNLSDITGPNVSDITGPNVSDITGPNVSDITGTTTDAQRRAVAAGFSQSDLNKLADQIDAAYELCYGGADCAALQSLLDQANGILGSEQ
ncbi:MAG: hypothetical protein AAFV90_23495 [Cyanobacteria bacterium J06634_5]